MKHMNGRNHELMQHRNVSQAGHDSILGRQGKLLNTLSLAHVGRNIIQPTSAYANPNQALSIRLWTCRRGLMYAHMLTFKMR